MQSYCQIHTLLIETTVFVARCRATELSLGPVEVETGADGRPRACAAVTAVEERQCCGASEMKSDFARSMHDECKINAQ